MPQRQLIKKQMYPFVENSCVSKKSRLKNIPFFSLYGLAGAVSLSNYVQLSLLLKSNKLSI